MRKRYLITWLLILLIPLLTEAQQRKRPIPNAQEESETPSIHLKLSSKAVFSFKNTLDDELNRCGNDEKCINAAMRRFDQTALGQINLCENDDECKAKVMRKFGASSEAVAFSRLFQFKGFMTSFVELGKVNIANVYFTGMINDNERILLVNGSPPIMDVEGCGTPSMLMVIRQPLDPDNETNCLANIEIEKDPLYRSLVSKLADNPPEIWGGHAKFETMQYTRLGGQRIVIRFDLLSCHACTLAGYAHVAYDFDSSGRFLGTNLLRAYL